MSSILDQIAETANSNQQQVEVQEAPISEVVENVETETTQEVVEQNNVEVNTETQTQEVADVPKEKPSRVFASDKVAELNAYLAKNPDKEISDWQKLKTPTSDLDSKELLKQFYSDKEDMTDDEIAYEFKKLGLDGDDIDEDFEDDDDKLKRKATMDRELRKAREWREAHVAEQLSDLNAENAEVQPQTDSVKIEDLQKEWQANAEKSQKVYLENVYSELSKFDSVELNVNGDQVAYVPDEDFKSKLRAVVENPNKLYQKFQNEDSSLKDSKGWIDLLMWGNEETREKLIDFRVQQAIIRDRQAQNNNRRNINTDTVNGVPATNDTADGFKDWYKDKMRSQF